MKNRPELLAVLVLMTVMGAAQTSHRDLHIDVVTMNPSGTGCDTANKLEQYSGDLYTCDPNVHRWRLLNSLQVTQNLPLAGGTLKGPLYGPSINGVLIADNYPGSDIGAKINNAVSVCPSALCTIQVNASGTISTVPNLPSGTTLIFNPSGTYSLACHWVIAHRGVTVLFNGASLTYTLGDGETALYVGKNINSVVNILGATVTWVSGSTFNAIDRGDQVSWISGANVYSANVAYVTSSTSLTLTTSQSEQSGVPMNAFLEASTTLNTPQAVALRDLSVTDNSATAADTALAVEMADEVRIDHFTASSFVHGTCLNLLGAISANISAATCVADGTGLNLNVNSLGGFAVTGSNSNRFFGIDLLSSAATTGIALHIASGGGSLNSFYGLRIEGNVNTNTIIDESGANFFQFSDYERNGNSAAGPSAFEIDIGSNNDTLVGPSQMQSANESILAVATAHTGNILENLIFNAQAPGAFAYRFVGSSVGLIRDISVSAGTSLSGNSLIMDSSGNLIAPTIRTVDHYLPVQSMGTQTASHVACIKSVGPPVEIGTCSGKVNRKSGVCETCN